jgi:hypothetical protein
MNIDPYTAYLIDVACEFPGATPPPPPAEPAIADFLHLLATVATTAPEIPITRVGVERAIDILCAHPAVIALFQHPDATTDLANLIFDGILPVATPLFRDYWDFIIAPIINEHIAVASAT